MLTEWESRVSTKVTEQSEHRGTCVDLGQNKKRQSVRTRAHNLLRSSELTSISKQVTSEVEGTLYYTVKHL